MNINFDVDSLVDTESYQKFMEERAKEKAERRAQNPYGEVDNSVDWFKINLVGILEDLEGIKKRVAKISPQMVKNLMLRRYYDRNIRVPKEFLKMLSEVKTAKNSKWDLDKDVTMKDRLVNSLEDMHYVCDTLNEIFLRDRIKKLINKINNQDYSEILHKDNLKYLEGKALEFVRLFQSVTLPKELLDIAEKRIQMKKMPNTATILAVFRKWSLIENFNTAKKTYKGSTGFIVPLDNPYIPEGEWRLGNEVDLLHYREMMAKSPEATILVSKEVEDTETMFNLINEDETYSLSYGEADK